MLKNQDIEITKELIASHGINDEEYAKILELIGREPTYTELGIFSAMWNEHCSYKSSKLWLKTLPTKGERVIHGPGENAGVVDIGDGQAVVFKMESHNHPSFIEPYQGAATGVGGILRDVFTMGARPIAAMNALRFGAPEHEKTRHLVSGVVEGVGGYGNSFGVPTVGGEVEFDARYNGNILVNAFAAGLLDTDKIFLCAAKGVGLPIVYLGAKTGRDGVGGATMASAEFGDDIDEKRPTVQVGDPFTEKCLLEACLELMATGAVIAIQDMGAAGLTCSAVEMGAQGNLGVELNLNDVPVREEHMTPYEMMLSESQERMLMVLDPNKEEEAQAVFKKWELDFAIVGKTTDDLRFRCIHNGIEVANLPIKDLGDEAPEYDRPRSEYPAPPVLGDIPADFDPTKALMTLIGNANGASRRWVWEQYDTLIQGNSVQLPGGDAGVVRVEGADGKKALAFSVDVTPRYCEANPREGGKQAVAECWRNLSAVGALPLASTDNLNFGNPEKPEIMEQFAQSILGIGDACRALDFPIVSGNVSLYNETNGIGILPTPAIGGVGLMADWSKMMTQSFKNEGDVILLVGKNGTHLGQSAFLRDCLNRIEGDAPTVDLEEEAKNGAFVRSLIDDELLTASHDLSDGGLAVALAEMAIAGDIGAKVDVATDLQNLFGEDQARYCITANSANIDSILARASEQSVSIAKLGTVGGERLQLGDAISLKVTDMRAAHESWFPDYMAAEAAE
jgi:phosphoribosylformylglycinamidine synthase II